MLHSISPVDGRYAEKTAPLNQYFSEAALIRMRVKVELKYLLALAESGIIPDKIAGAQLKEKLQSIEFAFNDDDVHIIKDIESNVNHDVKAVEYYLKDKLEALDISELREWVHFGLTSQDINNSAFPLMIRSAYQEEVLPAIHAVRNAIDVFAKSSLQIPMMAYTHGQPASPTMLGKEMLVFVERLDVQIEQLEKTELKIKFGGATGNFNAHSVAFPKTDWNKWADEFASKYLNIGRYKYTTQIEHYDQLAALCHCNMRINTILIDFCRDIWSYISMNYLLQKTNHNEVGSSAMPHKVNPIDFENAEGNLGFANAMFAHLADKLPVSRLQRDLTDSTVLRNIGVPVAHTFLAMSSIQKGIKKISPNEERMRDDLNSNWSVLAEAVQTILRREGVVNPYEMLKDLSRGKEKLTKQQLHEFIKQLDVKEEIKNELLQLTPSTYTGIKSIN